MSRRYQKGDIAVLLMPDQAERPVMVRRQAGDRPFDLFLTIEEATDVADALDDLLDYVERLG